MLTNNWNTLSIAMATNANGCTVNELLCFLVNRMNTMPTDVITKIIGLSDFYDEKEVVGAKECLLSHIPLQIPASII